MAEMLHFGADIFAALDEYIQDVAEAAPVAQEAGLDELRRNVQKQARMRPQWAPLAEHIETWDENGEYRIGIRKPELLDQAAGAEFGDPHSPPVPLLRRHPEAARSAEHAMEDVLHFRLGIPR